jgi:hypothetical protein
MSSSARRGPRGPALRIALGAALSLGPCAARAFPPYRSTDAETAGTGELEVRLGVGRLERESSDNEYTTPLARVNLGLRPDLEAIAEFEHPTGDGSADEAALGFKWVARAGALRVGIETLALPPMSARHSGMGVESQAVATLRRGALRLHVNAGGFHDSRPVGDERGWRGSVLAERQRGRARLGIELFGRKARSEPLRAQLGSGIILQLGSFDVRAGVHVGLTSETPDLALSFWISRSWSTGRGRLAAYADF